MTTPVITQNQIEMAREVVTIILSRSEQFSSRPVLAYAPVTVDHSHRLKWVEFLENRQRKVDEAFEGDSLFTSQRGPQKIRTKDRLAEYRQIFPHCEIVGQFFADKAHVVFTKPKEPPMSVVLDFDGCKAEAHLQVCRTENDLDVVRTWLVEQFDSSRDIDKANVLLGRLRYYSEANEKLRADLSNPKKKVLKAHTWQVREFLSQMELGLDTIEIGCPPEPRQPTSTKGRPGRSATPKKPRAKKAPSGPSEKQLRFARDIADALGIEIDLSAAEFGRKEVAKFISNHRVAFKSARVRDKILRGEGSYHWMQDQSMKEAW